MRQILLVAPILIPLAAASVTAVLWSRPGAQRAIGLAAAIALFLATVLLLRERAGSGNLNNWDKCNFCLTAA